MRTGETKELNCANRISSWTGCWWYFLNTRLRRLLSSPPLLPVCASVEVVYDLRLARSAYRGLMVSLDSIKFQLEKSSLRLLLCEFMILLFVTQSRDTSVHFLIAVELKTWWLRSAPSLRTPPTIRYGTKTDYAISSPGINLNSCC